MKTQRNFWYVFMPYCIRPLGNEMYAILNRHYKPLGCLQTTYLPENEYQALLEKHAIKFQRPQALQSLHREIDPNPDGLIILYDSATNTLLNKQNMRAYLEKLSTLMKLGISYGE